MLDYQLNELKLLDKKNFVLYNPTGIYKELNNRYIKKNTFLYLGSLYGKRDPETLIIMFLDLLEVVSDAKLIFVGSSIILADYLIPEEKLKNFEVVDWTDSPEKYIEEAEILLDYNANIDNDVFLSSKLTKYLAYNRKVLILSGINSAPEQFSFSKENSGIWNVTFSKSNFIETAIIALNRDIFDWSDRIEFCRTKSAVIQIKELIGLISK
jgi:hypothetical protein